MTFCWGLAAVGYSYYVPLLPTQNKWPGIVTWLVVWNIFYFSIYWEESSQLTQLTNIFQMCWNHQPVITCCSHPLFDVWVESAVSGSVWWEPARGWRNSGLCCGSKGRRAPRNREAHRWRGAPWLSPKYLDQKPWDRRGEWTCITMNCLLFAVKIKVHFWSQLWNKKRDNSKLCHSLSFWQETVGAPLSSRSYDYESEADSRVLKWSRFWGLWNGRKVDAVGRS